MAISVNPLHLNRMSKLTERIAGLSVDRRALLEERLLRAHRLQWRPATIPRRAPSDPEWLSFGQEQMWFLDQLEPGTPTYNIPDVMRVTGPLNIEALESGFRSVVARHEVLRTRVGSVDGNPIPAVNDQWEFKIRQFDVRGLPQPLREAEASHIIQEQARQPFNIAQDLMLRAVLVRLGDDQYRLLVLTHHIAWDVSSRAVLYRELSSLYQGFTSPHRPKALALGIQYSDFAAWQRRRLQGETFQQLATYWREQLGNAAHVFDLPTDRPRGAAQSFRGAKHFFSLSSSLVEAAKE